MSDCMDNTIEYLTGDKVIGVTASSMKLRNRLKALHDKHPQEVTGYIENKDGVVFAHVPVSWLKISPPRVLTEEQREANAERLRAYRNI